MLPFEMLTIIDLDGFEVVAGILRYIIEALKLNIIRFSFRKSTRRHSKVLQGVL